MIHVYVWYDAVVPPPSVVLFGNVFTATHWMAAALTFGGARGLPR